MEDFLQREIDKIGQFLLTILSKFEKRNQESQSLDDSFLKEELQEKLHMDLEQLLDVKDPVSFLIQEYGFTNENMVTLVWVFRRTYPANERAQVFIQKIEDYLNTHGTCYLNFNVPVNS